MLPYEGAMTEGKKSDISDFFIHIYLKIVGGEKWWRGQNKQQPSVENVLQQKV